MSTFGGIYVGNSGITANQNSLNTTAHNLVNLNGKGYTRQQVYQADLAPNDVGASSISPMQAGLGVNYSEARQIRDYFLDKAYRLEIGRDKFYDTAYTGVKELELYFGELEGVAFQDSILNLYQSIEEWDKIPDDSNNLDLVILRSFEFLERADDVYQGLKNYQTDLNQKIKDQVADINDIGNKIVKLNKDIMRIEAAGIERANDLRDERNALIDDLSQYIKVEYEELKDGVMTVKIENEFFVSRSACYEMDTYFDKATGFTKPIWSHLAKSGESLEDIARNHPVFNYDRGVASKGNTDIGSLKAMVMIRGDKNAHYDEMLDKTTGQEVSGDEYTYGLELRTMMNAEAELDKYVHEMVTQINNLLSPLTSADKLADSSWDTDNIKDSDGNDVDLKRLVVWDEANAPVGGRGTVPGEEMFVRQGMPRYHELRIEIPIKGTTDFINKVLYVYNPEDTELNPPLKDPIDLDSMYTLDTITINPRLLEDEQLLPHLTKNGSVNFALTSDMVELFENKSVSLNPNNTTKITVMEYYQNMINQFAIEGETYKSKEQTVAETVESISNKRQQVLGVSSDEELSNMIKYQNAFNASSRYINVVNEMIEHIITRL